MTTNSIASLWCHLLWISLLLLPLLHMSGIEARRTGYRQPPITGRSASASVNADVDVDVKMDAAADVGSGRDLFKKFMLWRGLFPQQPARDNVIVITPPSPSYFTPTTTTTTTTYVGNNTRPGTRWRNLEVPPVPTMPTSLMLDDDGGVERVTKKSRRRQRPNGHSNGRIRNRNRANGHKKKTRHRHIHKRQQRQLRQRRQRQQQREEQRQQLTELAAAEELEALALAEDFDEGQQSVLATVNEQSQLQSILRRLHSRY